MTLLKIGTIFGALLVAVLVACSQTQAPTPTLSPTPTTIASTTAASPVSTPTLVGATSTPSTISASSKMPDVPGLERVVERFGFALVPEHVPDGFKPSGVSLSGRRARLLYGDVEDKLIVAYPVQFSPEPSPIMEELGVIRPQDALVEVEVDGRTAFLMIGGWSDATIIQGPALNPADAVWDYDKSLTLFYDYRVSDGPDTGVAVQALFNPSDWITREELVRVAESLARFE